MLINLAYLLLLLPLSLFHHNPTIPAAQDFYKPAPLSLFHAVSPASFRLHLLWLPLFPLYLHLCMALAWFLLVFTPVVWTATHHPEDPREACTVITQLPPVLLLQPPQHTFALILCT